MENNLVPAAGQGQLAFPGTDSNVEATRAAKEVEGAILLSKKFPRNTTAALTRITEECKRKGLAEKAEYAYPRGGQTVRGPSIRLAEVLARNWGNLLIGTKELERRGGESLVETFCWDIETNVKEQKVFSVPHVRFTKNDGIKHLTDPRDIYEVVANNAARRRRACIMSIIPIDIIETAREQCQKTLSSGQGPLIDRIRAMIGAFTDLSVTQEMLEHKLGHNIDVTSEHELVDLRAIFNSLKDGMGKREQFFEVALEPDNKKAEQEAKAAETAKKALDSQENALGVLLDASDKMIKKGYTSEMIADKLGKTYEQIAHLTPKVILNYAQSVLQLPPLVKDEPDKDPKPPKKKGPGRPPKKKEEPKAAKPNPHAFPEGEAPDEPIEANFVVPDAEPDPEANIPPIEKREGCQNAHKTLQKIIDENQYKLSEDLINNLKDLRTCELRMGDAMLLARAVRMAGSGDMKRLEEYFLERAYQPKKS